MPSPVPAGSLGRVRGAAGAELERLLPPGANYVPLPLQLPGACMESREMAGEALVKAAARPWVPRPFLPLKEEPAEPPIPRDVLPALGNSLLQGSPADPPWGF